MIMFRHRLVSVFQSSLKNVGNDIWIKNGCVSLLNKREYASLGEAIQRIRFKFFNTIRHHLDEDKWCKIFAIEGNIGAGKHDFGKQLSDKLDLKFCPQATPDYHIIRQRGAFPDELIDWMLNPESVAQKCNNATLDEFTKNPSDPIHTGKYQIQMHLNRYIHYCDALAYLLQTGRGVTTIRNYFSDRVFAETLRKMGWLRKDIYEHYYLCFDASNTFILHPQVVIYLDVPARQCFEKVQASGNEVEKRLPLEYYEQIEQSYKNNYLPYARERGVTVIEMDWSDPLPINQVIEVLDEVPDLDASNSVWRRKERYQLERIQLACENSLFRATLHNHYLAEEKLWLDPSASSSMDLEHDAVPFRYPKGLNSCLGDKFIYFKNM